nr:CDP-alcohol phosphatidyltransferase family protein [uncultured Blautia sp.]
MLSFMLMEKSDVKIHLIHSLADDRIPFCQYFIIPYVLWYFFLIGTVIYFALSCPSKKEYYQYLGTLGIGMTLFLLISYIYPNGQNMRPDLTGDGIFISAIRFLYKIDTPTNIFPSMHVFNATASCVALFQNERCRRNRTFTVAQIVLTVSIVLSTMFLKQHSVADVMTALILNILCYQLFYRIIPARQAKLEKILTRKEIFTVPNLLSSLRLCLAIAFLGICQRYGFRENRSLLVMIILVAAATDLADGKIARTFHQISKVGRALDPLADKAMQGVMIACLMPYYPLAELVLLLLFVKELMTMAAGWKVIMETETELEAQWHGKLNTAVTYIVVLILTAGARLPYSTANVLIGACAVCMIMSFVMYMSDFRRILAANGLVRSSVQSRYDGGWMQ